MKQKIRLATHSSPLALKYAARIADEIRKLKPGIEVELLRVSTRADQFYYQPPAEIGGKCQFLSEVIEAVQLGHADLAAHVIEETPDNKPHWPRGWLSVKCKDDEGEAIHLFAAPKQIPDRFWQLSRKRS